MFYRDRLIYIFYSIFIIFVFILFFYTIIYKMKKQIEYKNNERWRLIINKTDEVGKIYEELAIATIIIVAAILHFNDKEIVITFEKFAQYIIYIFYIFKVSFIEFFSILYYEKHIEKF